MTIDVTPVAAPDADIRALIGELNDELGALYSAEQRHGLDLDAIFQPHIRFFVARRGGLALGCGGVALFDGFAELKRMYVRPAARGQGVADALMTRLTAEAAQSNRSLLRLETGVHSRAAIAFYRRSGFAACGAFAPYSAMPPEAVVTSVFMEKPISAPQAIRP